MGHPAQPEVAFAEFLKITNAVGREAQGCRPEGRRYKSADVRTGQYNGEGKSKSKGKSTGLKTGRYTSEE